MMSPCANINIAVKVSLLTVQCLNILYLLWICVENILLNISPFADGENRHVRFVVSAGAGVICGSMLSVCIRILFVANPFVALALPMMPSVNSFRSDDDIAVRPVLSSCF